MLIIGYKFGFKSWFWNDSNWCLWIWIRRFRTYIRIHSTERLVDCNRMSKITDLQNITRVLLSIWYFLQYSNTIYRLFAISLPNCHISCDIAKFGNKISKKPQIVLLYCFISRSSGRDIRTLWNYLMPNNSPSNKPMKLPMLITQTSFFPHFDFIIGRLYPAIKTSSRRWIFLTARINGSQKWSHAALGGVTV